MNMIFILCTYKKNGRFVFLQSPCLVQTTFTEVMQCGRHGKYLFVLYIYYIHYEYIMVGFNNSADLFLQVNTHLV